MVGSIIANLSPFVQFVGRVMRVIEQNQPGQLINQGDVVFCLGGNVARRWDDFCQFRRADQEFFAALPAKVEEVEVSGETVDKDLGGLQAFLAEVEALEGGLSALKQPENGHRTRHAAKATA